MKREMTEYAPAYKVINGQAKLCCGAPGCRGILALVLNTEKDGVALPYNPYRSGAVKMKIGQNIIAMPAKHDSETDKVILEKAGSDGVTFLELPTDYDVYKKMDGKPLYAPGSWTKRSLTRSSGERQQIWNKQRTFKTHDTLLKAQEAARASNSTPSRSLIHLRRVDLPAYIACHCGRSFHLIPKPQS